MSMRMENERRNDCELTARDYMLPVIRPLPRGRRRCDSPALFTRSIRQSQAPSVRVQGNDAMGLLTKEERAEMLGTRRRPLMALGWIQLALRDLERRHAFQPLIYEQLQVCAQPSANP